MSAGRPASDEYAAFFAGYVSRVPEDDVSGILAMQVDVVRAYARGVTAERETYAYAAGKWNIREVLGHVVDAERVFGYRAFCISRGEKVSLPAFDEQQYAARSPAPRTPLAETVQTFAAVREANLAAVSRLDDAAWREVGTVNGFPTSVRALAFIMAGHVRHHLQVLADRYA
jgi:hypothetical protein